MKIIYRNFTRLLSMGGFEEHHSVEAMSEYKWNRLLAIAEACDVSDFIYIGIVKSDKAIIPSRILTEVTEKFRLFEKKHNETDGNMDAIVKQLPKKFTAYYLNRRYSKLVFNEIHSIDTSINSLVLLNRIIDCVNTFLDYGLDIRKLLSLGSYIRSYGDKVDFVKVENWIDTLGLDKMCNYIACHLILLFNFEQQELPFIKNVSKKQLDFIQRTLEQNMEKVALPSKDKTMLSGDKLTISPIHRLNSHPLKYIRFCPIEAVLRFTSNALKSLSNIDE